MPRTRPFPLVALLLALGGRTLPAQAPQQPQPTPADPTIVATVQRLFDAMAAHDTATARALLLPGTRFVSISSDTAPAIPRSQGDSAFLRMLAGRSERLLERMWAPVVQVQGRIATLWTPYDFHVGGRFSHCGIDAVTLLRTDAGWQIGGLLYTVQRTGCAPSPLGPPATAAPTAVPATGATSQASRVFEIRTYTTHPGKLEALQRRFRDHTTRIFAKHGMTNIGYWVPQDSARSANTLVYILAHPDREAARRSWAAFGSDPEWQRVRTASEADGPIVAKVESVFATPTDYSPIR